MNSLVHPAYSNPLASPETRDGKRRVFIVDDHPITRQGVRMVVDREADMVICGEAGNTALGIELISRSVPDLVIIEIALKNGSGLELVKNLKTLLPDLPVLVMSIHDETLYAERSLRAGARGYIMKREASEKVVVAIRRVLSGDLYLSEKMKEKMLHRLVKSRHDEVVFTIDTLSDRELEVFQLIGNGYSTRQIAAKLSLSIKTIDSYREHLKLKLRLGKGADLVRYAIQWVRSEGVV